MKKTRILLLAALLAPILLLAQDKPRDKGLFVEPKNPFWDEIQKSTEAFWQKKQEPRKAFVVDLSRFDAPTSLEGFNAVWHNPPVSQGNTNTCWCYSTTSMLESEVYRLTDGSALPQTTVKRPPIEDAPRVEDQLFMETP